MLLISCYPGPALSSPSPAPAQTAPFEAIKHLVLDAVSSPHTRRSYDLALRRFLAWYRDSGTIGFDKALIQRYRSELETQGLASASVNVHLSAIQRLVAEAADNGLLAPAVAAGIARIRGVRRAGARIGNWLTPEEATALLNVPDAETLRGCRDRAILALLIGCGLRRGELVALDVLCLQLRDGRWTLPDLAGKGNRLRTVPVPVWVKGLVDRWMDRASIEAGPLFRPLNKAGRVLSRPVSEDTLWNLVREYGSQIGQAELAPHDLRRTCAKLCRGSGGELEQIQFLLGHASIQTTERYLGTRQNLAQAVNDWLPLNPDPC